MPTKYILFTIIITLVNGSVVFAQDSISLNLEQALELATNKNKDISIAENQVSASHFALKEAKGNFLPELFLNANYNRNINRQVIFLPDQTGMGGSATELGSDNDYRASLNLSMPLFSQFNKINKNLADTRFNFQTEMSRGVEQSIINAVKKSYFNYLIALEVVKVQQGRLQNAQEIATDIEKKVRLGKLTSYDLASAKVQVANAKNSLLEAESNKMPLANNLKLLLGLNGGNVLKLTEPISIIDETLIIEQDVNSLLKQNSKLKQLEIDIERNKNQVKLSKSAYFPTLDAVGNYNYQAQADNFNLSEYNWVNTTLIGLQLQLPIFNGTITKIKVEQAKIAKEISEEEKDYTTKDYRMQFDELISKLDFSKQKVAVQKENMELTEEALLLSKKRYRLGAGTFLEVNDAEFSFTQARLNWLQAILEYKSAYYDYQLLVGVK